MWCRTVFSDEKRFFLDCLDVIAHYWVYECLKEEYFSRCMKRGGGFMICATLSAARKSNLVFIDSTIDSVRFLEILENTLEPFIVAKHYYDFWFQQDNSKAHTADHTIDYFTELGVQVLEWPNVVQT